MNPDAIARGLGWLSIGLGATEIAAAAPLARSLGMEGKEKWIRLFGGREIAQGVSCLTMNPPTAGVWSRVAGDILDIAALSAHMTRDNPKRGAVGLALGAVLGVTLVDAITGIWLCEGQGGPITRTARRSLEQWEHRNELQMSEIQQRGGQYASEIVARASRSTGA